MNDLTPDALVLRGGLFPTADVVHVTVSDAYEDGFGPVLSVFAGCAAPGEEPDALVERLARSGDVKNNKIRLTTVSRLQDAGFTLEQDQSDGQPSCHYHVIFGEPPGRTQAEAFVSCFDQPIPNPARGAR